MGQLFSLLGIGPKRVFLSDPIEVDEEEDDREAEVPDPIRRRRRGDGGRRRSRWLLCRRQKDGRGRE